MSRFPRADVHTMNEHDPIMVRVPSDHMDIGANAAGMPKSAASGIRPIEHVGRGAAAPVRAPSKKR